MCRGGVLVVENTHARLVVFTGCPILWTLSGQGAIGIQFTGGVGVALVDVGCDKRLVGLMSNEQLRGGLRNHLPCHAVPRART